MKSNYINVFNTIDVISICLNIYLLQSRFTGYELIAYDLVLRIIAVFLMWINFIYWLRVFE